METEENRPADDDKTEEEHPEKAAADPDFEKQGPDQDGTDNTTFDTDQHSDAPGPFGTG